MNFAESAFNELAMRIGQEKLDGLRKRYGELPDARLKQLFYLLDQLYDGRIGVNIILRTADEAIEAGGGTFLTKEELEDWKEGFSHCVAKMMNSRASTSQVRMAAIGALGAAFLIGAASAESEVGAAILAKWKKDLLLRAQLASLAKSAPRKQETLSAVRLAMKATPAKPTRGEAFARHIQRKVAERLGRDVSASTIRNAVRAILEEVPRK